MGAMDGMAGFGPAPAGGMMPGSLPVPLVRLSAAMSLDGCIDGCGAAPLVLSSPEDCRAVHALRAEADAVLVGAGTLRRDDPRLTVRFPDLVAGRRAAGRGSQPMKVVVTGGGDLPADGRFYGEEGDRLILCPAAIAPDLRRRLEGRARVVVPDRMDAAGLLDALAAEGVRHLLVEGGSRVLTLFLAAGAFHRLRLAVAPFFVGSPAAPRLVGPGPFLHGPGNRLVVERTSLLGDVTVIDLVNPGV